MLTPRCLEGAEKSGGVRLRRGRNHLPNRPGLYDSGQLWKNLLRRTCTVKRWEGEKEGVKVQV